MDVGSGGMRVLIVYFDNMDDINRDGWNGVEFLTRSMFGSTYKKFPLSTIFSRCLQGGVLELVL